MRTHAGKLIVDSFYPQYICRGIAEIRQPSLGALKNSYAISERIAKDLGVKALHISELTTMLGYTKTDIAKLLQAVKNKDLSIVLVGIGGTGSNFLHFMHKMTEWVGKDEIFVYLRAYDDDQYDVPNLLRIPFTPKMSANFTDGPGKVTSIPKEFKLIANTFSSHGQNLVSDDFIGTNLQKSKTIIYGAPDMATRQWLTESEYTFIAATHKDNMFSLIENPEIDQDLIIETYGKINLSMFFMNHLSMTIRFLEELKDRTDPFGTYPGPIENVLPNGAVKTIKKLNHTIDSQDFTTKHADKILTGFKAGSKKLYVPVIEQDERNIDRNLVLIEED